MIIKISEMKIERIREIFVEVRERRPRWSDYLCFVNTVYGRGITFNNLRLAFNELVDKKEYASSDKDEILKDLYKKTLVGHA